MKTTPSRTESEANSYLEGIDAALLRVAEEAAAEANDIQGTLDAHRAAQDHFRRTRKGLLPATAATAFFDHLASTVNPGETHLGKSREAALNQFLDGWKSQLERSAREGYLRQNAAAISTALGVILESRSRGRQVWRNKIADEYTRLDKSLLLNETPLEDHPRVKGRLGELENTLLSSDAQYDEAVRFVARLKSNHGSDDIFQVFTDAKGLVRSLPPTYEAECA